MRYIAGWFCTGCLICHAITSQAVEDAQLAAIKRLGELNGIALNCGALPETRRMKQALVATLPKQKQLGELFDYQTNQSFMQIVEHQTPCPAQAELHLQVDAAIQVLERVYGGQ